LVSEARGRRVFPAVPERRVLLVKASGEGAHGGGPRLPRDTGGYRLLRGWIAQGAVGDGETAPRLERIEVVPSRGTILPQAQQSLQAWAHYADGSRREVTSLALYESNDAAMAEVSEAGLVQVHEIPGKVAVMVRF